MAGQKNVHGCFWLLLREIELGGKFLKQIFVINNFLFLSTINTLIHHSHNKPTSFGACARHFPETACSRMQKVFRSRTGFGKGRAAPAEMRLYINLRFLSAVSL
uniref:(northern house mosquito) hypothetical protein n=1 Tax=Culex pipiens TaxID=7175 RepID=A0A8D8G278_CULPI